MSKSAVEKLSDQFDDFVKSYDKKFEEAETKIEIANKTLKAAMKEQLPLQLEWELVSKRANKLFDTCEYLCETLYADAITSELKDSYRSTSISEAREFAKADVEYKKARRLLIEIREIRDEARGVLEVINSRKYKLNNITNAVIASSENHII